MVRWPMAAAATAEGRAGGSLCAIRQQQQDRAASLGLPEADWRNMNEQRAIMGAIAAA